MRLANVNRRACAITETGGVDLNTASGGRFAPNVDHILPVLHDASVFAATQELDPSLSMSALQADLSRLGPPVTRPGQVFAIGLNYADHAGETDLDLPTEPMVFTKWASSVAGPAADIKMHSPFTDWEVELVVVVGIGGRHIPRTSALDHIAGFCVGQDISDRKLQMASKPPQFSLGKSRENFSPIGPWMTTIDELPNPADLSISCSSVSEQLQVSRTSKMIFDVPTLIEYLSSMCELRCGDLIFTGTPSGVGVGRDPRQYIQDGWVIESTIEGLGTMRNRFTT